MNWFDEVDSDASDICDSEIEFELYSQLHYNGGKKKLSIKSISSRCNQFKLCNENGLSPSSLSTHSSDIEEWQVITSSSDDDGSSDISEDLWRISNNDSQRMNKRILRYYNKPKVRCKRCYKVGHYLLDCDQPRKIRRCCLCGNKGHMMRDCKVSKYLGHCYSEDQYCHRCNQKGHSLKKCPDLWRQFHLTVTPGRIVESKKPNRAVDKRVCYHCCEVGHLPHVCEYRWDQDNCVFLSPTVFKYDRSTIVKKSIKISSKKAPESRGTAQHSLDNEEPKNGEENSLVLKEIKKMLPGKTKKRKNMSRDEKPKRIKLDNIDLGETEKKVEVSSKPKKKRKDKSEIKSKSKISKTEETTKVLLSEDDSKVAKREKVKTKLKKKSKTDVDDKLSSSKPKLKKASKKESDKSEKKSKSAKKLKKGKSKTTAKPKSDEVEITRVRDEELNGFKETNKHEAKELSSNINSQNGEISLPNQKRGTEKPLKKLDKAKKKIKKFAKKKKDLKKAQSACNGLSTETTLNQCVNTVQMNGGLKQRTVTTFVQSGTSSELRLTKRKQMDVPFPCA